MSILLQLTFAAAFTAPSSTDDGLPVNFVDDVQPILREHCQSCHRGSRAKNGLNLKTMKGALLGGSSGAAVVPGDSSASLLYLVISHEKSPNMPPDEDRLPDELLDTIRQWIDEGCRETATSKPGVRAETGPAFEPVALPSSGGAVMPEGARTQPVWSTFRANTVTALAASPSAPLVAVAGHEQVTLYGLTHDRVLAVLPFPEGQVHSLRFSPTGAILLGGGGRAGDSGLAVAWDVVTGARLFELGDEPDVVLDADLSLDHSMVILGGPDRIARAYSTSSGELLYELTKHNDWVTACAFSPDGVLVATADRAGGLFVWEAMTGREFHQLEAIDGAINALDWRADSLVLAAACEGGDIRQYEMNNGNRVRRWNAHSGVLALDWLPDGRIASAGRNHGTLLSNTDGSRSYAFSKSASPTTAIAATADGAHVLVGTLTGGLRHYVANEKTPHSYLRVNPRTNEERAVIRSEARLAALEVELPNFKVAVEEAQVALNDLTPAMAPAEELAATTEAAAQQAAQGASQARAEEEAAAARLAAIQAPLPTKEAALAAAEAAEPQLRTAGVEARAALDEALAASSAAEEAFAISPDDPAAQAAQQAAAEALAGATGVTHQAELDLAKAEVATHSARTALALWRERLEAHDSEHAALETRAVEAELVATNTRATATDAANQLTALQARHTEAAAALTQATTTLETARTKQAHHVTLLETARPAWDSLRAHLDQSGGRVPQGEEPALTYFNATPQ
jgi:hypothetical protein